MKKEAQEKDIEKVEGGLTDDIVHSDTSQCRSNPADRKEPAESVDGCCLTAKAILGAIWDKNGHARSLWCLYTSCCLKANLPTLRILSELSGFCVHWQLCFVNTVLNAVLWTGKLVGKYIVNFSPNDLHHTGRFGFPSQIFPHFPQIFSHFSGGGDLGGVLQWFIFFFFLPGKVWWPRSNGRSEFGWCEDVMMSALTSSSSNSENSVEYICYNKALECVKLWDVRPLCEGLIFLMDSSGAKGATELQMERP